MHAIAVYTRKICAALAALKFSSDDLSSRQDNNILCAQYLNPIRYGCIKLHE